VLVYVCYRLTAFHSPSLDAVLLGVPPQAHTVSLSHTHGCGRNERIAALVTLQCGIENILPLPRATAATEGEVDWRKEKKRLK